MRKFTPIAAMIVAIIFLPISDAHGGLDDEHEGGWIQDVIIIELCDDNETCDVSRPSSIVEYFGSDSCEPCGPVEEQLNERNEDSVFIISHHPSPTDDFWLPESRTRFQQTYGLWGYPDLIIDGHYLLAGKSQANELENVISNSTSNWSGIQTIDIDRENSTLSVTHNVENGTIDVWTVGNYRNFTNMALNYTNLSQPLIDLDGDYLVVILSIPGEIRLATGSSLPSSGYEPDQEGTTQDSEYLTSNNLTIIIIIVLLLMIIAPTITRLNDTLKDNNSTSYEEE